VALDSPYQGSFFGVIGKPGEVLVYGLRGHVFRSVDGGASWTALSTGLQVSLTAATLDAEGHYRLLSQAGQLLVSTDDGARLSRSPKRHVAGRRRDHSSQRRAGIGRQPCVRALDVK
jgi:photosystem II stability/assembly factor-like uncharacterized protein